METEETILIIDDEVQIRRLLEISLHSFGFKVSEASTGKDGAIAAATNHPSLIILDLGLPDIDGLLMIQKFREWYKKPIIVLSVRNSEEDIISALDAGADDYLTKPFRTGELFARIRVALRRNLNSDDISNLSFGSLSIDFVNHIARKNETIIKLTSTEFSLLSLFTRNAGKVLTHQFILKEIWGFGYIGQTQYLRVFVAQLRKKIEDNPAKPLMLVTESGIGYRFQGL